MADLQPQRQQQFRGIINAETKPHASAATYAGGTTVEALPIEDIRNLQSCTNRTRGGKIFVENGNEHHATLAKVGDTHLAAFPSPLKGPTDKLDVIPALELVQDPHNQSHGRNAHSTQKPQTNQCNSNHRAERELIDMTGDVAEMPKPHLHQKKENQNLSRERQQQEIRTLRVLVKELEGQHKKAFNDYINRRPQPQDLRGEDTPAKNNNVACLMGQEAFQHALALKRSAARAMQVSDRATNENTRFRGLIGQQRQVLRNVGAELFGERYQYTLKIADVAFTKLLSDPSSPTSPVLQPADLSSMSECLEQDLDAQYQKQDEQGDRLCENMHSRVRPFSPESVARATWECLDRGVQTPAGGELKVCRAFENTLEILLRDAFPAAGRTARHVIEIGQDGREIVRLYGKGWSVLQYLGVQCDRANESWVLL